MEIDEDAAGNISRQGDDPKRNETEVPPAG
jgi:hypothetical protein